MTRIVPCYANGTLDRAVTRRRDESWLADRLTDPPTKLLVFWRGRYPIDARDPARPLPILVPRADARTAAMLASAPVSVFLGVDETDALFGLDLSDLEETEVRPWVGDGTFVDLREVGAVLAAREA